MGRIPLKPEPKDTVDVYRYTKPYERDEFDPVPPLKKEDYEHACSFSQTDLELDFGSDNYVPSIVDHVLKSRGSFEKETRSMRCNGKERRMNEPDMVCFFGFGKKPQCDFLVENDEETTVELGSQFSWANVKGHSKQKMTPDKWAKLLFE